MKGAQMTTAILTESTLELPLLSRGKVRDIYDLGDKLLIVATDRLSAFDVVLPTGIPDKGAVLTQMSAFWFEKTGDIVPNHFISVVEDTRVPEVPVELPREMVGRAMVVRKAERIDVECVARGYITGSGWSDYKRDGRVSGIKLPEGLEESEQLPEPIFTPTTKAEEGHDMPIEYRDVVQLAGERAANAMKLRSLALYRLRAGVRAGARDHHRRHEVRVRLARRRDHLDRRGADAGLEPVLAGGRVQVRALSAELRQAVRAGLPERVRLGQGTAGAGAASGGRREDGGEVPGGIRAGDRTAVGDGISGRWQ